MLDWSVKNRKIAAGIVLLLVSIGYGIMTSDLPKRTLPDTPDPAFMPWINAVSLGVLAILLAWQGMTSATEENPTASQAEIPVRAMAFVAAFFIFIVLLPALGFLLAGIPFFAALMLLFGERRLLWLLLGSVGGPVLLFLIFRHGFNIILPRGVIGALFG